MSVVEKSQAGPFGTLGPDSAAGAQFVDHPADFCFRLPPGLTHEHGAFAEPLSVGAARLMRTTVSDPGRILSDWLWRHGEACACIMATSTGEGRAESMAAVLMAPHCFAVSHAGWLARWRQARRRQAGRF